MLYLALAVAPFAGFTIGFLLGQRSVKIISTRTERLQVTERLEVERVIPEANPVPTGEKTMHGSSIVIPPQYRNLLKEGDD